MPRFAKNTRRVLILGLALIGTLALIGFIIFVPVVSLRADVPGSGGLFTTVTTQNDTTTKMIWAMTPEFGQGYGSITFCFFGQGALFIDGGYYPLTKATLQTEGAFCPALNG
jgi:hypothetical protein